jgi:hypothetical protein
MRPAIVVLTLVAGAVGAGGGFVGGFVYAVTDKVHTDTQVGCALLQAAETAGYISRDQRGQLVDMVVPKNAGERPNSD